MTRDLLLGDTRAYFLGANGFCKTEVLQQIFSDLQNPLYMIDVRSYPARNVAEPDLEGKVNRGLLDTVSRTIDSLRVTALTMGAKSLEELLLPKRWWTPLPSIQVTERPDVACSYLLEGHILLLVDNSPSSSSSPVRFFSLRRVPRIIITAPLWAVISG